MAVEFVVFDHGGNEIEWIDPYQGHEEIVDAHVCEVDNTYGKYRVVVPPGGKFEIRALAAE